MVAQAFDAVFLIPFIGDSVDFPLQGNRLVKGSLEGADQHRVGRKLLELADGLQVRLVVGGSHYHVILHALQDLRGQLVDAVMAFG